MVLILLLAAIVALIVPLCVPIAGLVRGYLRQHAEQRAADTARLESYAVELRRMNVATVRLRLAPVEPNEHADDIIWSAPGRTHAALHRGRHRATGSVGWVCHADVTYRAQPSHAAWVS